MYMDEKRKEESGATTLFLVRHGETVDNARQIMQGQTHGCLNEQGREQAQQVAQRMADEKIDAIVASDLHRAIQTAEIIAALHSLEVKTTPLLRERDWGSFTGRFIPDLKGLVWPDDIESEPALLQRAADFLQYITATYPGKRVVAVGHGIINKAILAVYAGCTMREVQRMKEAPDEMYLVKDGVIYQFTPRLFLPLAKKVNLMTGKVTYPTNADRIRNMTDEELAEFILGSLNDEYCLCPPPFQKNDGYCRNPDMPCTQCWIEWLMEESDG